MTYYAVKNDRMQTPLFVTSSAKEMAAYIGTTVNCLHSRISKQKHKVTKGKRYESTILLFAYPDTEIERRRKK